MKFKYLSMALVAAFLLIGSIVSAQNRIYIEDAEYKAGENGLEILVLADHDFELAGVSFSFTFDSNVLEITGIEAAGVTANADFISELNAAQIATINTREGGHFGTVQETEYDSPGNEKYVAAGNAHVVGRILFNTKDVSRTTTNISLVDDISGYPAGTTNALVDSTGTTYRSGSDNPLVLSGAELTVDPLEPEIQLIEDNNGRDGGEFTVVGLNFGEPGLAVRVCDRPAAFSLSGDEQTLTITAPVCPTCPDDEECWAELEITNENGSDSEALGFRYDPLPVPVIGEPSNGSNEGEAGKQFFIPVSNIDGDITVTLCDVVLQEGSDYNKLGSTTLSITAPECGIPGWSPLVVTNEFGTAIRNEGFNYISDGGDPPEISGISLNTGKAGDLFFIAGNHFIVDGQDPTVRVCGVEADLGAVVTNTSIQVIAPACGEDGWAPAQVITADGQVTETEGFFYEPTIGTPFVRGNANDDAEGAVDISDVITILTDRFLGEPAPAPCADALDVNDDGTIDISDPVALLAHLFLGTFDIPAPFPAPGLDPSNDTLPEC